MELKEEIGKPTYNLRLQHSSLNNLGNRHKTYKDMEELNNTMSQLELTGIMKYFPQQQ